MDERHLPPVVPLPISPGSVPELVARMGNTSFQARNLALATEIWSNMLRDEVTIFLGLAGAMVPAGMRTLVAYLIQNRLIDCLVSTGANLFHDLHESLGRPHRRGSATADDVRLRQALVNRIYDVYAPEEEIVASEDFITAFSEGLDAGRPYATREYLYLLGQRLGKLAKEEGILTSAARAGVPIYCPAIADSVYGMAIATGRAKSGHRLLFDVVKDALETLQIAVAAKGTGVIYIGGGVPKNFIQQTQVYGEILGRKLAGHRYAIQVTTDAPQWGGLSGSSFEEARSWGKVAAGATAVTVYCEATIALPIMVSALAESCAEVIPKRKKPTFIMGEQLGIR